MPSSCFRKRTSRCCAGNSACASRTCATSRRTCSVFFFQAEGGIRDLTVTGVQTCALPICGGEPVDRDRIAGTAEPALEAPRLALHPIHLRVETKVVARLHPLLAAEPAAEAAGRSEERRVGKEGRSRWSPYH